MRTEYLLQKEVDRVLDLLTPENRLVMRVCLHTGLRLSDVLQLRTDELKPHFWVTESKTGKRKQIGLPEPLLSDLQSNAGRIYAFEGCKPEKHRTRQAVWKDVKRAAVACRLTQNVAPHSARKVYAVDLLRKYGDIEKVRKILNHQYASTTIIYAMADKLLEQRNNRRRSKPGRKKC